ncbi:ubiquitin-specific protease ESD4 [Trifolium repens]|nr:ubiquitin-specific protease ESD4 [Trifolium repens]
MFTRLLSSGTNSLDMNEEIGSKSVQLPDKEIGIKGLPEITNQGVLHPCKETSEAGSHSDSCAHDNILKEVVNEIKELSTKVSEMDSTNSRMIEVLIGLVKLEINIASPSTCAGNDVEKKSCHVEEKVDGPTKSKNDERNKGKSIAIGNDYLENAKHVTKKMANISDISNVIISEDDQFDIDEQFHWGGVSSNDHQIQKKNVTTPYKGPTTLVFDQEASLNEISADTFRGTTSNRRCYAKKDVSNVSQMVTKKLAFTPSPGGGSSKKRKCETLQQTDPSRHYLKSPPSSLGKQKHRYRPYNISPNLSTLRKFVKCKFRPTQEMKLTENEIKLCAYIFRDDLEESNELVFSVEDQIGIKSDFHCLIPGGYVGKSILRMMAARVTWNQKHTAAPNMWCLPPTFASDALMGMRQESLEIIYKTDWMSAYPTLKLIYVPIRDDSCHWFLMVVHVEERKIYHLDSHLLLDKIDSRHQMMKKIAKILSLLVLSIYNLEVPFCLLPDFEDWDIVEPRGVPNCGHSENSGIWVAEWMNMQSCFNNQVIGVLDDKLVRMKIAIRLLLEPHNLIKDMLEDEYEKYWNKVTGNGRPT